MEDDPGCKGCSASVRLSAGEVQRILAEYFAGREVAVVDEAEHERRLASCRGCEQLVYGTTCQQCGCLVEVRAKLADQKCPGVPAKW